MESGNNNLKKEKNKKIIIIFLATFFISLFLAAFAIKALSPNVDVEIADSSPNQSDVEEATDVDTEAKDVDNRLKWIQFEDNMPGVSRRYDTEGEEQLEPGVQKTENKQNKSDDLEKVRSNTKILDVQISTQKKQDIKPQAPLPTKHDLATVSSPTRVTKVYIGYYSTQEQAVSAQNKIISSGVNVSPFVKEVNGLYVVQAGSYANSQKAQTLYSQLSAMGYPAKLVTE